MTTLGETSFILKRIGDAYGQEVTEKQARAYHNALGSYPRMVLVAAGVKALRSEKFFPRIVELSKRADQVMETYKEPEWAKVDEVAQWYMYCHNLSSTDELSEEAVQKIYQTAGVKEVGND